MPLSGKKIIFLVQDPDASAGSDAFYPGFQTDGTWTYEGDLTDEQTKNGRVLEYGEDSESGDLTMFMSEEDDGGQRTLKTARKQHKKVKLWKVNVDVNANGKYDATFAYILIESYEEKLAIDGFVEVSVKFQVQGQSQDGEIDLDPAIVALSQYPFETPGESGGNPVTALTFADSSVSVAVAANTTLQVNTMPSNATDKTYKYTSSDETVATVDSTGKVTGVKVGTVAIIAELVSNPSIQAIAIVTVTAS